MSQAMLPARTRTVREVQQEFAESLGFGDELIWDHISVEQADFLKNKIRQLIPDQEKGQTTINKLREALFDNIWAQRKYTNCNLLSSIIYVLVTKEKDFNLVDDSKEYSVHPVFRTRRCIANRNNVGSTDSRNCCMIFIDERARVYKNWEAFINENVLPEGTLVAPRKGIYNLDEHGQVRLAKYPTPASSLAAAALNVADTVSTVGGFLSACVPVAAFLTFPVSAPLMAAAGAVGLGAAGYTALRSGSQLVDRSQHEQSIGLDDKQARNTWLGLAAGVVGLGAAGATKAATAAASAGKEVTELAQLAVNGMNISSIVLSGTGIAEGVLDLILKYRDNESISKMDVLQLAASLAIFTHSVYNFQMASKIVSDAQNSSIQNYRETLSRRQKRMFDKMTKETIRIRGTAKGKIDVVRAVNDAPSKQQFNDLFKINKKLNQRNVRFAFGEGGEGVVLNNEIKVNTQNLRANVQHQVGPDILSTVTQSIPETFNGIKTGQITLPNSQLLFVNAEDYNNALSSDAVNENNLAHGVKVLKLVDVLVGGVLIPLNTFGEPLFEHIINAESFETTITQMAKNLSIEVFTFIMKLCRTFIDLFVEKLQTLLEYFISTESIIFRILSHILQNYADLSLRFLESVKLEILEAVINSFETLNPNNYRGLNDCDICKGCYNITLEL